jgi:uncharacterized protein (DUF1330 family)
LKPCERDDGGKDRASALKTLALWYPNSRGQVSYVAVVNGPIRVYHPVSLPQSGDREDVMKARYTVAIAMIVGMGVGAAANQGLHAQGKPPVYLINEIDVTDPENYGKEFAPKAQATVKSSGARFIVIGGSAGAGAKPVHAIEGNPPKRVTIQVWESMDALNSWYNGADYQAALKIGQKYATFRRYAVEAQ